ncbi:MAG: hypothetical protein JNM17_01320 [Archangium sp.]|nr:hypothetical protein [Archangium sp.]
MVARKSSKKNKKNKKAPAKAKKAIKKPAKAKKATTKVISRAPKPWSVTAPASPMAVPDSKESALAWFGNLANRVTSANAIELQQLVSEARTYDLVGLGEVLQNDEQVLELNKAANTLIEAALETVGPGSPEGFQLQVLRDIINDS